MKRTPIKTTAAKLCAIGEARELKLLRKAYRIESVESFTAHLHRLNFYVVPRKLIPKLQAFSQRIQETPIV